MGRRDPSSRSAIGPPKASASGCRARPSTSSRSQDEGASTSSSTNTISSAAAAAIPVFRAEFRPGTPSRTTYLIGAADPPAACPTTARVPSAGPSSTTSTS